MKIFKIVNEQMVFYVKNKRKFCEKMGLTLRLLEYTQTGERNHHKGYKIESVDTFIQTDKENGSIRLYGTDIYGYILTVEEKKKITKAIDEVDNMYKKAEEKQKNNIKEDTGLTIESYEKEISKLRKELQRTRDNLNLNRKENRKDFRYENFLTELKVELKSELKRNLPKATYEYNPYCVNDVAILQISDLHFGQKVELDDNIFNLVEARKRLDTYFDKCIIEIEQRGIEHVYVALVGDLIHSASMLTKADMKLASEYNEVEATILCFRALAKNIDRLVEKYNVYFCGVVGNESRFANHMYHTNLESEASNSMDYMIYAFLEERYSNYDNVVFVNSGKTLESVVAINGKNIGLIHGDKGFNHSSLNNSVWKFKARMSQTYGSVDYVLLGHIHETYISNEFARNSSLVGSNSYSALAINIPFSTPAQNLIIVGDDIRAISVPVI